MVEKIYVVISFLRFFPHLFFYLMSGNKSIIKKDVDAYKHEYALKGNTIYLLVHL